MAAFRKTLSTDLHPLIAHLATRHPTTPAFTGSPVPTLRHVPPDQWHRYGSL